MYTIALCDDDIKFLDFLENVLINEFKRYDLEIKIIKFDKPEKLLEDIEKKKKIFNIIFLDLDMPQLHGFKVAERLRFLIKDFTLIFTTNMESEATKGYRYNAFRFILKNRLQEDVREMISTLVKINDSKYNRAMIEVKFKFKNSFDLLKIHEKDIICFYIEKRRVFVKTIYSEYELLILPLHKYKDMLQSTHFIIVNRSFLVNLDHIQDIIGEFLFLTNDVHICMGSNKKSIEEIKTAYMIYRSERV